MSDRKRNIEISANARADLVSILIWSENTWGEDQQQRYERELLAAMQRAGAFPESGRRIQFAGTEYRKLRAGHHVLFYEITEGAVRILRVLHERQQVSQQVLIEETE
jgi:toxin ParE1/3/4